MRSDHDFLSINFYPLKIGLNEEEAAENLETAIDKVLSKGYRTADLADGSTEVLSCSKMGNKIIDEI